ncbi:coiled-coil domain-containing protein 125-like [Mytilus californianus]|uniref:coiled-coil domain-containing protein 125-like n=1 Tax=Mytilus californianus TaxID=6549 RepID=UPI0022452A6B|nr:coiled-coil domain-containing protein 125-like [Mytilus californianus]
MSVLSDDDSDFKENGDLGLGLGLKPGGLRLNFYDNNNCQGIPSKKSTPLYTPVAQNKYRTLPFLKAKKSDIKTKQTETAEETPVLHHTQSSCELEIQSEGCCSRVMNKSPDLLKKIGKEEIERKLKTAEEEVEELKCEIEVYQKRLDAKYKAIAILREQSKKLQDFREVQKKKSYIYNHSLEQEVNKLHFELDQKEVSLENSQAIWAERFDNVCRENSSLTSVLEEKNKALQKVSAQNKGLSRERDELLALLDVKERERYMKTCSRSSDDHYSNYTSAEIAVLGACKCRVTSPEPCGCAHAAAHLRQEVSRLKSQVESHKKRKKEVMLTVDAYRQAFEEQLQKNKVFLSQLTSMAVPGTNKLDRAKAVFRFLLETLNDDDLMRRTVSNSKLGVCIENGEVDNRPLTDRELVLVLTQILHERNEAYAHQKIASQVLAEKVQQLEAQLSQQDEVFSS